MMGDSCNCAIQRRIQEQITTLTFPGGGLAMLSCPHSSPVYAPARAHIFKFLIHTKSIPKFLSELKYKFICETYFLFLFNLSGCV